jgi:DNA-binding NarL/FixJ family response regulator
MGVLRRPSARVARACDPVAKFAAPASVEDVAQAPAIVVGAAVFPVTRVLIVDDDPQVGSALRELLTDYGHKVVGLAGDSIQALVLIKTLRPDVVVTDLRMPGMSGLQLTQQACRLPRPPGVVMVSAYDDPALQREARDAGVHGFIVKGAPGELVHKAVVAAAVASAAGRTNADAP